MKTVRLTESDLVRIVKRVLSEQTKYPKPALASGFKEIKSPAGDPYSYAVDSTGVNVATWKATSPKWVYLYKDKLVKGSNNEKYYNNIIKLVKPTDYIQSQGVKAVPTTKVEPTKVADVRGVKKPYQEPDPEEYYPSGTYDPTLQYK